MQLLCFVRSLSEWVTMAFELSLGAHKVGACQLVQGQVDKHLDFDCLGVLVVHPSLGQRL